VFERRIDFEGECHAFRALKSIIGHNGVVASFSLERNGFADFLRRTKWPLSTLNPLGAALDEIFKARALQPSAAARSIGKWRTST
jgi:hypothetical protein